MYDSPMGTFTHEITLVAPSDGASDTPEAMVAGGIICVFGDPDSPPIIGAHTLEGFLLSVDPVQQRLVPVEGYWLQGLAYA